MSNKKFFKLKVILFIILILVFVFTGILSFRYKRIVKFISYQITHFIKGPKVAEENRILIFAPHCDDETLAAGGLIREAVLAKSKLKVVIITNGDGFSYGAKAEFKKLKIKPSLYVKFAYIRQKETIRALSILGVNKNDIIFLGYPDRGLSYMWRKKWKYDNLYTSRFTKDNRSPYRNSFHKNAPYCGESLLSDIKKMISIFNPTDIYIPHPDDDHPDHWATNCFVSLAVEELRNENKYAKNIKVYLYVVHRGDWPLPQGLHIDLTLVPPNPLIKEDTHWERFDYSKETLYQKFYAIKEYKSQIKLLKRFLYSFVRKNEIFGICDPVQLKKVNNLDWNSLSPIILDPPKDTIIGDFEGSADLTDIYSCFDNNYLYLKINTRRSVNSHVQYRIILFGIKRNNSKKTEYLKIICKPPKKVSTNRKDCKVRIVEFKRKSLIIKLLISNFKEFNRVFLGVETNIFRMLADRTAYRVIILK